MLIIQIRNYDKLIDRIFQKKICLKLFLYINLILFEKNYNFQGKLLYLSTRVKVILMAIKFVYHDLIMILSMKVKEKSLSSYLFKIRYGLFVCLFCCFTSQVNSYGHCGMVSSHNQTFSWAGLNKRLTSNSCTYFRL